MPRQLSSLSLSDARRLITAGEKKAHELGIPYNLAVVDSAARSSPTFAWMVHGSAASIFRFIKPGPHVPSIWQPRISPRWRNRVNPCSAFMQRITRKS